MSSHEGEWKGEGWYVVAWSDGGMDWTNEGPVWFETEDQLEDELKAADAYETETHLAYAEFRGDGDEPEEPEE